MRKRVASARLDDEESVPELTVEAIRESLRRGAKSAKELHDALKRDHLAGMSRSLSLRLD